MLALLEWTGGSHAADTWRLLTDTHPTVPPELHLGQSIVSTLLAAAAIFAGISSSIALYLTFIVAILNGFGAILTGYIGVRQLSRRKTRRDIPPTNHDKQAPMDSDNSSSDT